MGSGNLVEEERLRDTRCDVATEQAKFDLNLGHLVLPTTCKALHILIITSIISLANLVTH